MSNRKEMFPKDPASKERSPTPLLIPLTVFVKVMPVLVVREALVPDKATGPTNWMTPPEVIALERVMPPVPDWVTAPSIEKAAPERTLAPEFWIVRGPAAVVTTLPPRVKEVPFKLIPKAPLVVSAPKVVEPADWMMWSALIAPVVLPEPDTIVKVPMALKAASSCTAPVPAVNVRLLDPPATVLIKWIFPPPAPVLKEEAPASVIAFVNKRLALEVEIEPLKLTDPPLPLSVNPPGALTFAAIV
jgi:hypothetical protein